MREIQRMMDKVDSSPNKDNLDIYPIVQDFAIDVLGKFIPFFHKI